MTSSGPSPTNICVSSPINFSDDYKLKDVIGRGAFSDVYSCMQRDNKHQYAAKVLKKDYGEEMDETAWKSISEVNATNSMLKHPFILSIAMAYHEQQSGRVFLLTELMNRSLHEIIVEGQCPLSDARIRQYMYQMLEGLKYLHENGFIHRDVKPENILLKCDDKWLKIGDLGSTCNVTQDQQYTEYIATRWYRSPECLLTQGRYSTKLDIWAAGCVLYEMATGNTLFDGKNEDDQMEKIDQVLGSPELEIIDMFKKHKSDVFVNRYETREDSQQIRSGVGLHTLYHPLKPAYEILKEMIVCNPIKRFSAARLLQKPYFYKIKYTRYQYKINKFRENAARKKAINCNLSAGEKKTISKKTTQLWKNKKGPGGDRIPDVPRTVTVPIEKQLSILGRTCENIKLIDLKHDNKTRCLVDRRLQDGIDRRNINIIKKSEFIHPDNRKAKPHTSKTGKKISFPENEQMTMSSVLTPSPIIKRIKKNTDKRMPFK